MNYSALRKEDYANGEGRRVSLLYLAVSTPARAALTRKP